MNIKIIIVVILIATGCGVASPKKPSVCKCCGNTYTSIDSAMKCVLQMPEKQTTVDERLLLFAFVSSNVEANQKLGWNIIKEQEIVNVAKQNYLLITLDVNQIEFPKGKSAPELIDKIKKHKDQTFFVITNQALYPFAEWTIDEDKNVIIDRLRVGDGP
jgi:hypothetical protein